MILAMLMLLSLLVVISAGVILSALAILKPPRMNDGKALYLLKRLTPFDLGMEFENILFQVRDERSGKALSLAAWWIPHPAGSDKTVIFLHGYADAKVGAIAWAPLWRELGWNVLAIDLRAHGNSGGAYTTAGVFERHDLDQVINQFRAGYPVKCAKVAIFGASLGAIVALGTAELRNDFCAVVLDCPLAHFRAGVQAHASLARLPLATMLPTIYQAAKWLSGADFDQIRPLDLLQSLEVPMMIIQSGNDPFVPPADQEKIELIMRNRHAASVWWRVDDVPHLLALHAFPHEYARRLGEFMDIAEKMVASRENS